jgi:aspartyl/asparaginyl beta-hydroxylase (cupin superfamily)
MRESGVKDHVPTKIVTLKVRLGDGEANRVIVPRSAALLLQRHGILACAFSALAPEGRIAPHRHQSPYVTASLCLADGGGSFIIADGERRDYRPGEWIVFDYRALHEVVNGGTGIRLVVLLLLQNRIADSGAQRL